MSRADYKDLRTAEVAVGDLAPDFQLARADRKGMIHLGSLLDELPVALVFGSYT
jgi:hypothetical protein